MAEQYLDGMRDGQNLIQDAVYDLRRIASAMSVMGFPVAEDLDSIIHHITMGAKMCEGAMSGMISHDFKVAQQSTASILEAALAGVELSRGKGNG